ncbi:MAG: MFS transporter [Acidimicrobiaceae bacterium]|jgi:MFS family permease|nr:MFS transporter [Acidimicrobiaceae bacterium]MDG1410609.1 MFS transporter [Acidimicrobiales bacterium]MDG2217287.1 MFS transporter [Acidimicrobiales bacterium]
MSEQTSSNEGTEKVHGIWSGAYLPMTLATLTIVALVGFGTLALIAALSSIAEDLGQIGLLPWVFTAYLATSAIAVVVAGPVIDAIGVRRTFRITGIWFLLSTLAAAAAPSMPLLILARGVQGFGGGLLFAVALAAIGVGYPHELRPQAFAAQSVMFGIMGLGGPALAGVLLAFGGWRIIFIIQLPLAVIALASGWTTLPTTRQRRAKIQTDWKGVGLMALLIVCSLVAVAQIGVHWWASGAALAATVVLMALYWNHSGRVDAPVLAREHFTRFPLRWVHVTTGLVMFNALAVDDFLPFYVQTARGRSVEFAAISLVFLSLGWTLGSLVYSRVLNKWRECDVILLGCWLIVPSIGAAGITIALDWPLPLLFAASALIGISVGLVTTAGLTLLQASSDISEMGRVTAAHQFIRQLAIMYGIALAGAIVLLVVDLEVGDVDAVRDVIAGENISLGTETKDAIRHGLAWIHVATGTISIGCLVFATTLVRQTSGRVTQGSN